MDIKQSTKRCSMMMLAAFQMLLAFSQSTSNAFSFENGNFAGTALNYREAEINVSAAQKPALVLYLHGGSSKGSDNVTQMKEAGIDSIYHYLNNAQEHAIFLVPQCPSSKSWGGTMNRVLKGLVDQYINEGYVDENRIYIFGGSMGGSGTLSFASDYPQLFSAVMAVAASTRMANAKNIACAPFYTVMGTADALMSVDDMTTFVNEVTSNGGIARMDVEEGWTHEITCVESYTTERLKWVMSHSKSTSGATIVTTAPAQKKCCYHINGTPVSPDAKGIIITCYDDGTTKKEIRK